MKAIQVGNQYEIYDDSLKTHDSLPAQTYVVRFSKATGFYLDAHSNLEVNEKIYGVHEEKVNKVISTFKKFDRNLGVILSGNKGIGKSVFAKMVSQKAVSCGIPVIVVDSYNPGIAAYIESIEQEVVILFDEFDKTFCSARNSDDADPQSTLLSLFDGMANGKKLFLVTCNELYHLNDYLINRPGRFHYHFRFDYPSDAEIRAYLQDKLAPEYWEEINRVIAFSKRVDLNYDCLRSIAFELNNGLKFSEAIQDLNIINMNSYAYDVTLHFENGTTMTAKRVRMDIFDPDSIEDVWVEDKNGDSIVSVSFSPSSSVYDPSRGVSVIKGSDLTLSYDNDYGEDVVEAVKRLSPSWLGITRSRERICTTNMRFEQKHKAQSKDKERSTQSNKSSSMLVFKLFLLAVGYSAFFAALLIIYIVISLPMNKVFEILNIASPSYSATQYSDVGAIENDLSWEFAGDDVTGDYSLSLKIKKLSDNKETSNIKEVLECLRENSDGVINELSEKYCPNLPPIAPTWFSDFYYVASLIFVPISIILLIWKVSKIAKKFL